MPEPVNVRFITYREATREGEHVADVVATNAHDDQQLLNLPGEYAQLVNAGTYLHRDDVLAIIDAHIPKEMPLSEAGHLAGYIDTIRHDITTRGS